MKIAIATTIICLFMVGWYVLTAFTDGDDDG